MNLAGNYRTFARIEAHGKSPRYEQLAYAVADDSLVLAFLSGLPSPKQQPNLLFAAARYLLGRPADIGSLRTLVRERGDELTRVMLARRTQTNEPARCAMLLPALAMIGGPLALLEVGASAGLTLLADRYSYDYGGHRVDGTDPMAPTISCDARGPVPLPGKMPRIVWRAGLDLNPLDVTSEDDVRWLECLLWPGETGRAERLAGAVATARRDPPALHRGDLLTDVSSLARLAPRDATLVIYHSAVLAYVDEAGRREFAAVVADLGAAWLSNEAPGVIPGVTVPSRDGGLGFVLVRDGASALAVTDPHGAWLHWLERDNPGDSLRVGAEGAGVPFPGVDDVFGCLARGPAVDDADERPVAADATVGKRLDPFGSDRPIFSRLGSHGFETLDDHQRFR